MILIWLDVGKLIAMLEEIGTQAVKDTQTQKRKNNQRVTLALFILLLGALCTAFTSNAQQVYKVTSKAKDHGTSRESAKTVHAESSSRAEDESTPDAALDLSARPTIDGAVAQQTPSPEPQKQS